MCLNMVNVMHNFYNYLLYFRLYIKSILYKGYNNLLIINISNYFKLLIFIVLIIITFNKNLYSNTEFNLKLGNIIYKQNLSINNNFISNAVKIQVFRLVYIR
jgi:hypothetical protein